MHWVQEQVGFDRHYSARHEQSDASPGLEPIISNRLGECQWALISKIGRQQAAWDCLDQRVGHRNLGEGPSCLPLFSSRAVYKNLKYGEREMLARIDDGPADGVPPPARDACSLAGGGRAETFLFFNAPDLHGTP